MKYKIIKTNKTTILLIELPEGTGEISVGLHCIGIKPCPKDQKPSDSNGYYHIYKDMFHDFNDRGFVIDITEQKASSIVDSVKVKATDRSSWVMFRNYINSDTVKAAKESLDTLMEANEVYFENPLGKKQTIEDFFGIEKEFDDSETEIFNNILRQQQEAQSKVWNKNRTRLFIK